ncbi:amine oxidase [Iodidimonas gelatinilytica]|uniref:Amine oxidase n=1 Tax=Iodidimonas gelatinilytica TaxID=1236966 RepID=A0A5A7MTX6_9PROT|nr:hydroxysqualene dehydroxylase HpnE [Iodidimonas gelatinilytica]GEQ97131.1 amine oxidase [Iodidimonas gelatinilytica]GEQ99462.1 amine oxidase [Iodidimonas gelatinilytica]
MARVHIIGGGLAGLAAAVRIAKAGHDLTLYETAARAGGRCRSFHDEKLGCVIDNGNHLMLSGNGSLYAYLDDINARDRLVGPDAADFPFVDLETDERWTLSLNKGRWQGWVLDRNRRIPGTRAWDYLSALRVLLARRDDRIANLLNQNSALYHRLWEPLIVAVLNTDPDNASAHLIRRVLLESFAKGQAYCQPRMARHSLADTLVDPALDLLENAGAKLRFHSRISHLDLSDSRILAINLGKESIRLDPEDRVILATPPWIAQQLLDGLATPETGETIVNVHFRMPTALYETPIRIIGLVGGLVQWIFVRGDVASVTISAANKISKISADDIARTCWSEVARALELGDSPLPAFRVIKEKRATFSATPDAATNRPGARTKWSNLTLAGDWTDTDLPSTIEGAIRSGHRAATHCLSTIGRAMKAHASDSNPITNNRTGVMQS